MILSTDRKAALLAAVGSKARTGPAWLQPARIWWRALPHRERALLSLGAAVLTVFVVWLFGVQPALQTIRQAPARTDALEAQLQTMQLLAAESAELRTAAPVAPDQAAAALQAATLRLGAAGRISVQGDRAILTLNGAGTEALRGWLAEARSGARGRPVEANLSRAGAGYSGTLVLAIGNAP